MPCVLKLVILLGTWNVICVSAGVDVIARLITDNITPGSDANYGGLKWTQRFEQNLKQGVSTIEKKSYVSATIKSSSCLKSLDASNCGSTTAVGFQFWMRYKGFISDILGDNVEYHQRLSSYLATETPSNLRWISCFNARHNGWSKDFFNNRCKNQGPTVSLFKVRDDAIFGGFTTADWGGPEKYAEKGFIFSLKNADNKSLPLFPLKTTAKNNAIDTLSGFGLSFGNNDLSIGANPNQDESSNCLGLGTSYDLPSTYTDGSSEAKNLLAGSQNFALSDMEVFYMECSSGLGMENGWINDSQITTQTSTPTPSNARLNYSDTTNMVSIGQYLEVQLNGKSLVTGFAVRAHRCGELQVSYQDPPLTEISYKENNTVKLFIPTDSVVIRYVFTSSISTSSIKFTSSSAPANCRLAVEIYGCQQECSTALGMENGAIKDGQITASFEKDNEKSRDSRANQFYQGKGCWKGDDNSYLQINLRVITTITVIGVQRCAEDKHHPKTVKIKYALHDENFVDYYGTGNAKKIFDTEGAGETNDVFKINLIPYITARKIRFYPHDKTAMRAELYGCLSAKVETKPTTLVSTWNIPFNKSGFGVLVSENKLQGVALTSGKKLETTHTSTVAVATWTRVTYWTDIANTKGVLYANEISVNATTAPIHLVGKNQYSMVTIDDSSMASSNPQNIQLSDVTVWKADSAVKSEVDKVVDGPVVFDATYFGNGSASVPYIVKSGWQVREDCTPSHSKETGTCTGAQDGGFLFLEASNVSEGTKALLESFNRVSAYKCFGFAYHMWGQNVGRLNVYVKDVYDEKKLVWRLGGDQGNQWHQAGVPLSQTRAFKIIIEGVVGDGFQGDIAVDSFHVSTQSCVSTPPASSITYTTGFVKSKIIGGVKESESFVMNNLKNVNAPNTFWVPCFIKSRGDNLAAFWNDCTGKGPTVTIGRFNQYIFGAYSDRDWKGLPSKDSSSPPYNIASSKAFIFSLTNPSSFAKVFPITSDHRHQAIKIDNTAGPHFSVGLKVKSNQEIDSFLNGAYEDGTEHAYFLTGIATFMPDELEVFHRGDFPCDKWCALQDWQCKESNGKCECDYSDRLIGWCLKGQPQAFLGLFDSPDRSPDAYWNFDNFPNIQNMKMLKSLTVSSHTNVPNGISRQAIKLDGATHVDLGNYSNTCIFNKSAAGLSVSLWLKYVTKTGAEKQTLFTIGDATDCGARLQITQPNSTLEALSVLVNINNRRLSYLFSCPFNIWSHLVIAWSSSTNSLTVYRNGKPVDLEYDICFWCNSTSVPNTNIYLGEASGTQSPMASFDELGVWCKGLTPQDVQEIFRFFQGPTGFYVFLYITKENITWSTHKDFEGPEFQDFKTEIISKIQSVLSGVSASNVSFYCSGPTDLSCNISIAVDINDGDTTRALFNGDFKQHITARKQTGVQRNNIVFSGYNTSAYDIDVTLEMPSEDEKWSGIYQGYAIFYHPVRDHSLILNITEERYTTLWSLENLTSYTEYHLELKLNYLGGTFRTRKISVWTGERAPDDPPLGFEGMPMNSTCIKLQWEDPQAPVPGRIRGFQINYNKSNEAASGDMVIVSYSNQSIYFHEICGLMPENSYDVQVAAFTIGLGPFTVWKKAWTSGEIPRRPPVNVISLNGTEPNDLSSTCLLTWNPPPALSINGNLTSYRVVYTNVKDNKTVYSEIGACNTSKLIEELDVYSIYKVVVAVSNPKGLGPYSEPVFCHTESTAPGAPPSNVQVSGNGPTSCLVQWGPVPENLQNGLILGYNITYLKNGDPVSDIQLLVVDGGLSNTMDLLGLEKFTKYNISIAAFNKIGLGNESGLSLSECLTEESAPDGVPQSLAVSEKTNTTCTFTWSGIPPDQANGIIVGYEATIENVNSSELTDIFIGFQMTCPSELKSTFRNLKPFHMYNITIAGFNSKAVGNYSDPLQCLTDEEQPLTFPPNITCQTKSSTIIEVCWKEVPLILRQGIVRSYQVFYEVNITTWWYTKADTEVIEYTPPVLCWNLTDLEEYSSYSMKVKAVTVKEGNFSETPVDCKTGEGVPRDAPTNVSGYNTSAYGLMVSWEALSRTQPGIDRGYIVFWRVWNASKDTTLNQTVPLSTRELHIEDLLLYTQYCVQVAAVTIAPGSKSECTYLFTDTKWLPPPDGVPSNLTESFNSTETNCSIEWGKTNNSHPDPDGRVLGYNVYYRIAGMNDIETMIEVEGDNVTQEVLQALEEYTKYEIRVAAYNLYGAGNKSDVMYCHTKEAAPSDPPANITAQNASSTAIKLDWFDMSKFQKNGIVRYYSIFVFEKALGNLSAIVLIYRPIHVSRRRRREITMDEHSQTITGLKKFTEYGIQLYGYTVDKGPLSPVVYVKTAEDAPTATVRNLTIHNSSSSSVLLEWNNVPPEYHNGIIRSFVIFYSKTDWPLLDEHNLTVSVDDVRVSPVLKRKRRSILASNPPEYRFDLTGLEIWTNYTLQVAPNTIKIGPRTNKTVVSTDEDIPCLSPDYITFDVPTTSSLLISWKRVLRHCRNGIILGYRLTYRELPNSLPVTVNFTATERQYIIENMNGDANYTVELLAFTSKGIGNASYDLAQPDKMGPRSSPINVTTFNFTTPTTLNVEWKPIEEELIEEKLMGYRVSWRVLSEGEEPIEDAPWKNYTVRKDTLDTVITGLKNYVHYQIEISGFTRGGNGPSGIVWGDTCRCFKRVTTNYRIFSPYNSVSISEDLKSINMSGMIPEILNNLTVECCQTCQAHGRSYVDFVQNGKNMSAFQHNEMDVKALIDDTNDLSFPVYGWQWQDRYQGSYRFIPLVSSPGFAFLLLEPETDSPLRAVVKSIIDIWPYFLITLLMALLAGIVVWFLDTAYNEEQFPHSFIKGAANGWWWAFISMTTLGYGDKVPASHHAKAFAVIWVLIGLVVYGILSSSITTAFTTIIYQSSTKLYGSKVATIQDTPEYRFAVRRNAQVNTEDNYTAFEQVLQALMERKVNGMLMDAYEAGTKREQFLATGGQIRIHKIYDFASTFGVVLAGPSTRLYQCSRNWMSGHRAEMSAHIAKFIQVVEEEHVNELVEITTGLFDPSSSVFQSFFRFSLIALGVMVVPGVIWEIFYQLNKRKRNKLSDSTAYNKRLVKELGEFSESFLKDFEFTFDNLRGKHKVELAAALRQRRIQHKDNGSFDNSQGLLPLDRLKDIKFAPTR